MDTALGLLLPAVVAGGCGGSAGNGISAPPATPAAPLEPLAQVTGVRVTGRGSDFLVWAWDAVEGATIYESDVFRHPTPSSERVLPVVTTDPMRRVDGLEPDSPYGIFVRAIRDTGERRAGGPWSDYVIARTTPPRPPGYALAGHVSDGATGRSLAGAVVLVAGDFVEAEQTTGNDGRYRFEDVAGEVNVSVTHDGYAEHRSALTMDRDRTLDIRLDEASLGSFGAGRWRVNDDIAPGRYFTDPAPGCFWERVGAAGRVVASEFLGFDAGQEIVDIGASDEFFEADVDCRQWRPEPRGTVAQGEIPPGRWLVGSQVLTGTYETDANAGCYWARLRRFSGETRRDVIENGFLSDRSRQRVEVRPTDVGFFSDAECGTWTRVGAATAASAGQNDGDRGAIGRNRQLYRVHQQMR